jgi:hypothetical protein
MAPVGVNSDELVERPEPVGKRDLKVGRLNQLDVAYGVTSSMRRFAWLLHSSSSQSLINQL